MSEEQIKQNAEDYINESTQGVIIDANIRNFLLDTYLAGYHSRDEEIKELNRTINEQDGIICSLDCEDRVSIIKERDKLVEENVKLRNPWISVEDRLPERMTSRDSNGAKIIDCCSNDVFGYDASYKIGRLVCYNHESEMWESHDAYTIGEITHWMPIPELKKGE